MGRRHQLFVICRINCRYRQLCAIHNQWLWGVEVLERCVYTLKIFQHPTNRLPIQQELIAAAKKNDEFWPAQVRENGDNNQVPFPFITTCVSVGASFRPDGHFQSVRPFYGAFDECDNDEGITVIDITDLAHVRYCFVNYNVDLTELKLGLLTPLSARSYLEAYVDRSGDRMIPWLQQFHGRDLITVGALKETWPHGNWQENGFIVEHEKYNPAEPAEHGKSSSAADARFSVGNQLVKRSANTLPGKTKSLRDHSMDKVLDLLLQSAHDNSDLVAELEMFPDFLAKLRSRLVDNAATLQPTPSVVSFVCNALEGEVEVNLSVFENFAAGDLAVLVAKLRRSRMKVLNLSNMPELTESALRQILDIQQPSLRVTGKEGAASVVANRSAKDFSAIVLLETPRISVDFLLEHMGHYDVYHSALFRRPMHDEGRLAYYERKEPLQALQFGAANTVSQLVWVGISSIQSCDSKLRQENGLFNWSSLKYAMDGYDRFTPDTGLSYKNFLLDIPSAVAKTVHGLRRLTHYLFKCGYPSEWPNAAARCFATTSDLDDSGYSVGPLSTTLNQDCTRQDKVESGKGRPLPPGQWAIILVHEALDAPDQKSLDEQGFNGNAGTEESRTCSAQDDKPTWRPLKRLRYAFIKALSESEPSKQHLLVTDVSGYCDDVLGGHAGDTQEADRVKKWWKKWGKYARYYKDPDMDEILSKVYSHKQLAVHQRFERGQWKRLRRLEAARVPPPAQPQVNNTRPRVIVAVPPPQPAIHQGLRPRRQ
ncbi:MAG: hypothetical protein Q9207_001893 [Kuettlingeria erythrocarpa]